jgi:hypothetical protein
MLEVEKTQIRKSGNDKDSTLTFYSKDGTSVGVSLSPIAQTQLLMAILAGAKGRSVGSDYELTIPPIKALDFKAFVLDQNHVGLEIAIQLGAAIHIGFDHPAFLKLEAEIQKLKTPAQHLPDPGSRH